MGLIILEWTGFNSAGDCFECHTPDKPTKVWDVIIGNRIHSQVAFCEDCEKKCLEDVE